MKAAILASIGALFLMEIIAITGCNKHAAGQNSGNEIAADKTNSAPEDDSWLTPDLTFAMVRQSAPQVRILPTRFATRRGPMGNTEMTKWAGIDVPMSQIFRVAYRWSTGRIIFAVPEPSERYDFIATLPQGSCEALQQELQKQFGLVGQAETTNTEVLVLNVRTPNAPGLKPPVIGGQKDYTTRSTSGGVFVCNNSPLSTDAEPFAGLQRFLENNFEMPVVDETGLTGNFSIDLKWTESGPNHKGLEQALANQLGLELVPGNRSIEVLVVEKAD